MNIGMRPTFSLSGNFDNEHRRADPHTYRLHIWTVGRSSESLFPFNLKQPTPYASRHQRRGEIELRPKVPQSARGNPQKIDRWLNELIMTIGPDFKHTNEWGCEMCGECSQLFSINSTWITSLMLSLRQACEGVQIQHCIPFTPLASPRHYLCTSFSRHDRVFPSR